MSHKDPLGTRLRFLKDFDFKPKSSITIAYKAGEEKLVTRACAEQALKAKVAERVTVPKPPRRLASRFKAGAGDNSGADNASADAPDSAPEPAANA